MNYSHMKNDIESINKNTVEVKNTISKMKNTLGEIKSRLEDGSEIGGSGESTSPCAWVGHLADLLRIRVNSQRYPSVYEDWRPKQ